MVAGRTSVQLSLQQARNLQLAAQGLLAPTTRPATPLALRRCIERMQLLQIDTIHVVARSPYLVLFARLGAYPMAWLDQALERGHLFETWAHEACFAPTTDLALHRSHLLFQLRSAGNGLRTRCRQRPFQAVLQQRRRPEGQRDLAVGAAMQ